MIDPPRPEAIAAVAACHAAGIAVKMITGDHAVTAAAIAREIGLRRRRRRPAPLTGARAGRAARRRAASSSAERPTSSPASRPNRSCAWCEALQAAGHVVAMTGDGVNDAPGAQAGRHRRGHGHHRHRRGQGGRRHGAHRRQLRLHRGRGRGGPRRLRQPRPSSSPGRCRPTSARGWSSWPPSCSGMTLPILPRADPVDQHDHRRAARPDARLRAQGAGHHAAPAARAGHADRSRAASSCASSSPASSCWSAPSALFEWAQTASGLGDEAARTVAVNVFMVVQIFYLFNCRSLRRSLFTYNPFGNRMHPPRRGGRRRAAAAVHLRAVHERRLRHARRSRRRSGCRSSASALGRRWSSWTCVGVVAAPRCGIDSRATHVS